MADDLWGEHPPALPLPGLCRAAAAKSHRRCPHTGAQGAGTDLQGEAFALLCKVRLCERGRFWLYPRRGGVVSDAAAVLRERFGMRAACALRINSGISFFIRDSEKPAGFSESPFHE